jgi:K+-sensing histidine kinase KdpD
MKYAPQDEITLLGAVEGEFVRVEVIDRGPGIPPEERKRVFELFYRLDSSDAREVYGRGLGLHLARRFLDVMKGRIEILDAQEGGTRVGFWLPSFESDMIGDPSTKG